MNGTKKNTETKIPHDSSASELSGLVSRPTASQVRQILMNEFGLTRESIRSEMERIVEQTITKHMQVMFGRGYFEKMAIHKTLEYLKNSRWEKDEIRKMIGEAAKQKAMEEFYRIYGG